MPLCVVAVLNPIVLIPVEASPKLLKSLIDDVFTTLTKYSSPDTSLLSRLFEGSWKLPIPISVFPFAL